MIDKPWYIHTMVCYLAIKKMKLLMYAATWLNVKLQGKEARFTKLYTIRFHLYSFQKRQKYYRDRSQLSGCQQQVKIMMT